MSFKAFFLCLQGSHVHDVTVMRRLLFDLWVDDSRVRDSCGVRTWGTWHHVVWEPAITGDFDY